MRALWTLSLLLSCATPPPALDADGADFRKGEGDGDGKGSDEDHAMISAWCASEACDLVWVQLEPSPSEPATWYIDEEEVGTGDGVMVEPIEKEDLDVLAITRDGKRKKVVISSISGANPGDTAVVILGYAGNSCSAFYIKSVGGCLTVPVVRFVPELNGNPVSNGDVVFTTSPPDNLALGHGYYARWGLSGARGTPPPFNLPPPDGLDYWFGLSNGQSAQITAHHGFGPAGHRLPFASCASGVPQVGPVPEE